jgi:WD40 repeat protein
MDSYDVYDIAFSPDGRTLAVAGSDTVIRLWDKSTHRQSSEPLSGHTHPIDGLAFSPDGRFLASSSRDGTARLWNWRFGRQLGEPLTISRAVPWGRAIAFSPDGRTLASGGYDDSVRLWDVPVTTDPAATICAFAGPLTPRQWTQYLPDAPFRDTCPAAS